MAGSGELPAARQWRRKPCAPPGRQAGFTYLGVLFLVSLLALTASMASVVWSTEQRRENERQLVFAGLQIQAAIEHYRQRSKEGEALYPRRLEDLLRDARSVNVSRHLRQIFPDPITGETRWGLIRLPDGGIVGVHSLSGRAPLQRGKLLGGLNFSRASTYRDWRFIAPSAVALVSALLKSGKSAPATGTNDPGTASPSEDEPALIDESQPTEEDFQTRTPEACDRITVHEAGICRAQAEAFGPEVGQECDESALQRSLICSHRDGTLMSPLVVR